MKVDLKMVHGEGLLKSVAKDLLAPDPPSIIASGDKKVNENSPEYDRGSSNQHDNESVDPLSEQVHISKL